jgi:hypothetical protein
LPSGCAVVLRLDVLVVMVIVKIAMNATKKNSQ